MSSKLGDKLAASVRGAKQLADSNKPAEKPAATTTAPAEKPVEKKEAEVVLATRRVWPD